MTSCGAVLVFRRVTARRRSRHSLRAMAASQAPACSGSNPDSRLRCALTNVSWAASSASYSSRR